MYQALRREEPKLTIGLFPLPTECLTHSELVEIADFPDKANVDDLAHIGLCAVCGGVMRSMINDE
jgi:hypothetical protein